MSKHFLEKIPTEIEIISSGKFFWHRNFIGKKMPVDKVEKNGDSLYFYVNPGIKRQPGLMEKIPFGIPEIHCNVTKWKDGEVHINENIRSL